MGSFIKGDNLEGLVVFLNETICGETITVTKPSVFVSSVKWAGTLSTPPLSGMPIASLEFAGSICGQIPPRLVNKIANDAGLKLQEAKRDGLSLWDLISTAAHKRKNGKTTAKTKTRQQKRGTKSAKTTKLDLACSLIIDNLDMTFTNSDLAKTLNCDPSQFSRKKAKIEIEKAKFRARKAANMTRGFYTKDHQVEAEWDQGWDAIDAHIDHDS